MNEHALAAPQRSCPIPVLCIGEALWDLLPTGEYLGGAPVNVAAHLSQCGVAAAVVSRLGVDARGRLALTLMSRHGIDISLMQVDPELPTGTVEVVIDSSGSARYLFPMPVAWDRIAAGPDVLDAARNAPAVVFGTLAQRSAETRLAIDAAKRAARWRVLDLNLRSPHDDQAVVMDSLAQSDFVKMNREELALLAGWIGLAAEPRAIQLALTERFGTTSLCITDGEAGAILWHQGQWTSQPACPAIVVDTVGAGDAFLAALLAGLLRGVSSQDALAAAAQLASQVAARRGAI